MKPMNDNHRLFAGINFGRQCLFRGPHAVALSHGIFRDLRILHPKNSTRWRISSKKVI
jgi:hypothetical protein